MCAATACSNQDLSATIPDNATGVVAINLPNIIETNAWLDNDTVALPSELTIAIENSGESITKDFLRALTSAGCDLQETAFIYFPHDGFKTVCLAKTDNPAKTREFIRQTCGTELEKDNTCEFALHHEQILALKGSTLMIASFPPETNATQISTLAQAALSPKNDNIQNVEAAQEFLDNSENALAAYFNMRHITNLITSFQSVKDAVKTYIPLQFLIDNDLSAIKIALRFNNDKALIKTSIEAPENSSFLQFLTNATTEPSSDFLNVVPASMSHVASFSVKGEMIAELEPIQQFEKTIQKMPFLSNFSVTKMVEAINGPLSIACVPDQTFPDEYNYIITAKSLKPKTITNNIKAFYASYGQAPDTYRGIETYAYGNKMIAVGTTKRNLAYVKILSYDSAESPMSEDKDICALFDSAPIAILQQGHDYTFTFTMQPNAQGEATYSTTNAAPAAISLAANILAATESPLP